MANIIIGDGSNIPQGNGYSFRVGGIAAQRLTWKCTDSALVVSLVSDLVAAGYSYNVQWDGPIATVEGTLDYGSGGSNPVSNPLTTIWERDIKVISEDILSSDLEVVGAISAADKKIIKDSLSAREEPAATGLASTALTIYTLMFNGVTSHLVYQPVIRRTKLCANSYATAESDVNVGKILNSGQMSSLEGAPGGLLYALPASGTGNRTDIALLVGYLKMPCRVQQQGDGRWQITQEWDYGAWAKALYAWVT